MLSMHMAMAMIFLISFSGSLFFPTCRLVNAPLSCGYRQTTAVERQVRWAWKRSQNDRNLAQLVTGRASTTLLAPSASRIFDERFSDVNALLSVSKQSDESDGHFVQQNSTHEMWSIGASALEPSARMQELGPLKLEESRIQVLQVSSEYC
jgi:hypothetical protein